MTFNPLSFKAPLAIPAQQAPIPMPAIMAMPIGKTPFLRLSRFLFYDVMTALDAIGPHEILRRLLGASVKRVARKVGSVPC